MAAGLLKRIRAAEEAVDIGNCSLGGWTGTERVDASPLRAGEYIAVDVEISEWRRHWRPTWFYERVTTDPNDLGTVFGPNRRQLIGRVVAIDGELVQWVANAEWLKFVPHDEEFDVFPDEADADDRRGPGGLQKVTRGQLRVLRESAAVPDAGGLPSSAAAD